MRCRAIKNNKKNKMSIEKKRKISLISMFITYLITCVIFAFIPNPIWAKIAFCGIMTIIFLFALLWIIARLNWKYKENGIIINDSVYVWNRLKKKYLGWSLVTGITQIIVLILGIAMITLLLSQDNTIYNTDYEYLASPPLIILYICVPIILFNMFSVWMNQIVMQKIFHQENFSEKLALENNWFFQNSRNVNIFIWLHISIIGTLLAFITYKEIEQNIKDNLTRQI